MTLKKICLPKFCIKYNRTFITQRQEAQLWIIKFRDNYYIVKTDLKNIVARL